MSIDREMATAYLLGELESEDRKRFEAEMSADHALRALVEELRPVVSQLEALPGEAWEPVEPPPLDIARATSGREPEAPLAERESDFEATRKSPDSGRSRTWARIAGFLATGAALLLAGFLIGNATSGDDNLVAPAPAGQELALDSLGEAPPTAEGEVRMVSSEGDQMRLDVSGLKPSPENEFYELWLLGADGELIALGSFRVGEAGSRSIEVPLPVDPSSFKYFDVSIQPENGDPAHSGRSVLRGLTSY
ncbi:MAG: hypothetical protein QG596_803 [Actinomycetota bacterium]|jgi:anti-sigma-K factor RskA|nr:hypothetical protein [Actinomycetota bacterium]